MVGKQFSKLTLNKPCHKYRFEIFPQLNYSNYSISVWLMSTVKNALSDFILLYHVNYLCDSSVIFIINSKCMKIRHLHLISNILLFIRFRVYDGRAGKWVCLFCPRGCVTVRVCLRHGAIDKQELINHQKET